MWFCLAKTCWYCYCCWSWYWGTCSQQFGRDFEIECWSRYRSWIVFKIWRTNILGLSFGKDFEVEVWSRFWNWTFWSSFWSYRLVKVLMLILVKILKFCRNFGEFCFEILRHEFDFEAKVWKRFWSWNFTVLKSSYFGQRTLPFGPLCLWQCFSIWFRHQGLLLQF